jgi:hypothetical protein
MDTPFIMSAGLLLTLIYYLVTLFMGFNHYSSNRYGKTISQTSSKKEQFHLGIKLSNKSGASRYLKTISQLITQGLIFICLMTFWFLHLAFYTSDYLANTDKLKQEAPIRFAELSKLEYPSNAKLIHISETHWGPNASTDIVFKVDDAYNFTQTALQKYKFFEMDIDFPGTSRDYLGYGFDPFENIIKPPFCIEAKTIGVKPRYFEKTREIVDPENFCGQKSGIYAQLDKHVELGVIMIIFPKEGLIWLNHSEWF